VKRPTMLVEAILRQAEMDLDLSVERDIAVMRRRCEHEGLSFLTITLPSLSDALERGLEEGRFSCPTSFSRHGSLPRFMGGFFNRVFTRSGELCHDANPDVIFFIRQICRFFKKLKIECSPARNRAATQQFVNIEGELREMTSQVERKDILLDKIAGIIWSQVFPEIDYLDLICHHGPGYTADKLSPNGRFRIRNWNQRSEFLFPSDLHCYPNYGYAVQSVDIGNEVVSGNGLNYLDIKDEMSVRVVFVPKTQTAPRVIAIEPSHVQYMQQSVKDYVYKVLETHSLTKRSIRFTRQDVNQRLAHRGSIDRRTATLDLKDASDRVHLHLVQRIFKSSGLLEYLEDARSLHATLPDNRNIVLFKYASMGSALCFPVEAMVFYTLIQTAMHQLDGIRPSSSSIRRYSAMIDIYGDDIIVPVDYADVVVRYLESYALKVNVGKSFKKGFFRESCGGDYFKGVWVNPIYARQVPHDDARDWTPEHVMSWAATADLFYLRGLWLVAQTIRDMVSRTVRRTIPSSRTIGAGLAFYSLTHTTDLRWNRDLQCWQQKRLQYQPHKNKDSIDGNDLACLNKWALSNLRVDTPYKREWQYSSNPAVVLGSSLSWDVQGLGEIARFGVADSSLCASGVKSSDAEAYSGECEAGAQEVCGYSVSEETSVSTDMGESTDNLGPVLHQLDVRGGSDFSTDYCLIEEIQRDPLRFLEGRNTGLDFQSSTKRGCFKSKSRWVTLAG